jgi:myo-inositol-1(or 4)-monophosphatase
VRHDPRLLATAIEAALAAGRIQRAYFRQNPAVSKKGPIDLVTAADLEVERAFRALIASRFPDHDVLGEEGSEPGQGLGASAESRRSPGGGGGEGGHHRWIIDPIDGTTNFAHGLALFCVSIALEVDGRVDLAVVYEPIGEELFVAERGQGARRNGARMHVSDRSALIDTLLVTGFPYTIHEDRHRQVAVFEAFLGVTRAVRRLGSAALDLCYVAAGRFDGFWEEQLHAWDIAAGALIVEEAGGRVTAFDGGPMDAFRGQIVASNGRVHDAMRAVIAASSADHRG